MGRCCFCENAQSCSSLLGGGSRKAVFFFSLVGQEARQLNNLLKKTSLLFSASLIKCLSKRCQVHCWVVGIEGFPYLSLDSGSTNTNWFPKASCCVFASGLDGSPGLWIAKIRSDAPIFVFNNRDKLCPLLCLQGSK